LPRVQVFEFNEFVHEKHMTISNSLLGTTFFTLTGTHGCHVAIGVLWLSLMYVRSFKPATAVAGRPSWLGLNMGHAATLIVFLLLVVKIVLSFVWGFLEHGFGGATIGEVIKAEWLFIALAIIALFGLARFARPAGAVDFDERNAIDVEGMGLYWHFVDIVWIVIFTAVYLLEYL